MPTGLAWGVADQRRPRAGTETVWAAPVPPGAGGTARGAGRGRERASGARPEVLHRPLEPVLEADQRLVSGQLLGPPQGGPRGGDGPPPGRPVAARERAADGR